MKIRGVQVEVRRKSSVLQRLEAMVNLTEVYVSASKIRKFFKKEKSFVQRGRLFISYVIPSGRKVKLSEKTQEAVRKATAQSLREIQRRGIASAGFRVLTCKIGGLPYGIFSKIMAQEVFKYIIETEKPSLSRIIFLLNSEETWRIFKGNVEGYLGYLSEKILRGPFLTVDGIILYRGGIILVERKNPPLGWALPGGFVDYGESVEEAVKREVKEETGLEFIDIRQFKVYSQPGRDPRFHTVSVVFLGKGRGILKASSDAQDCKVFSLDNLPSLAFDHRRIIEDYKKHRRGLKKEKFK